MFRYSDIHKYIKNEGRLCQILEYCNDSYKVERKGAILKENNCVIIYLFIIHNCCR